MIDIRKSYIYVRKTCFYLCGSFLWAELPEGEIRHIVRPASISTRHDSWHERARTLRSRSVGKREKSCDSRIIFIIGIRLKPFFDAKNVSYRIVCQIRIPVWGSCREWRPRDEELSDISIRVDSICFFSDNILPLNIRSSTKLAPKCFDRRRTHPKKVRVGNTCEHSLRCEEFDEAIMVDRERGRRTIFLRRFVFIIRRRFMKYDRRNPMVDLILVRGVVCRCSATISWWHRNTRLKRIFYDFSIQTDRSDETLFRAIAIILTPETFTRSHLMRGNTGKPSEFRPGISPHEKIPRIGRSTSGLRKRLEQCILV